MEREGNPIRKSATNRQSSGAQRPVDSSSTVSSEFDRRQGIGPVTKKATVPRSVRFAPASSNGAPAIVAGSSTPQVRKIPNPNKQTGSVGRQMSSSVRPTFVSKTARNFGTGIAGEMSVVSRVPHTAPQLFARNPPRQRDFRAGGSSQQANTSLSQLGHLGKRKATYVPNKSITPQRNWYLEDSMDHGSIARKQLVTDVRERLMAPRAIPRSRANRRSRAVLPDEVEDDLIMQEINYGQNFRRPLANKAARKSIPRAIKSGQAHQRITASADEESQNDDDDKSTASSSSSSERTEIDELASDSDDLDHDETAITDQDVVREPPQDVIASLEALSLSTVRMQTANRLPFLLRDLRRGFTHRCILARVVTKPASAPRYPIKVIYRKESPLENGVQVEYEAHMQAWSCPLCELHGDFPRKEMLVKHLEWDHSEVKITWEGLDKMILQLSQTTHSDGLTRIERPKSNLVLSGTTLINNVSGAGPEVGTTQAKGLLPQTSPPVSIITRSETPTVQTAFIKPSQESPPRPNRLPPIKTSVIPSGSIPDLLRFKRRSPSPSQTASSRDRSRSTTSTTRSSSRQSLIPPLRASLSGIDTPNIPPLSDPLGPCAQYPFLPGTGELRYSCRPGGPRLLDLLNSLPMEPFGDFAWYILDREEETFELDDMRDEDKVMWALWNRWIMLNRNKFVHNYYNGVIAFVNQFWQMIHFAAGWAALRSWLLTFTVNRFLKGSEIAGILRHYQSLTKMAEWDPNPI